MKKLDDLMESVESKALNYLYRCTKTGLAMSYDEKFERWVKPYPEVTGYLLSFFSLNKKFTDGSLDFQKIKVALLKRQLECGGWRSFEGSNIVFFDTAQIIKGLYDSKLWENDTEVRISIQRGLAFLRSQVTETGMIFPIYVNHLGAMSSKVNSWSDGFSGINCKFLELLFSGGIDEFFEDLPDFRKRIIEWSIGLPQIEYTHPGAYQLEGLLAAGHTQLVKERLNKFFVPHIQKNGFLPYRSDLNYSYNSGSAQIGILLAKIGELELAFRIFNNLSDILASSQSGGLIQYSYGDGSIYEKIHTQSNSWGTKYFLELSYVLNE